MKPAARFVGRLGLARWGGLAAIGLVGLLTVAGYLRGRQALVEAPANAGLFVEPARLDFGSVWASKGFAWRLPIHNPTSRPVHIVDLRSSCSCTAIAPRQLTIPPGGTAEVQLTLDLTPLAGERASAASNWFSVLVTPYVAGGSAQEVGWEVQGEVRNPFACAPQSPFAIDELVTGERGPATPIKLFAHRDFERVEAQCDPQVGEVRINTAGDRQHELTFRPASDQPLGPFEARVRVRAYERSQPAPVEFEYVLHGNVSHPVEALPAGLTLGALPVGEMVEETVTLVSRGGGPLGNVAVDRAPAGAVVEVIESSAEQVVLRVRQQIVAAGAHLEPVRLTYRTNDGRALPPLELNVAYIGVQRAGDAAKGSAGIVEDAAAAEQTNGAGTQEIDQ